ARTVAYRDRLNHLARRRVDARNGSVEAVRDPYGARTNRDACWSTAHLDRLPNVVRRRIDTGDRVDVGARDPDRIPPGGDLAGRSCNLDACEPLAAFGVDYPHRVRRDRRA